MSDLRRLSTVCIEICLVACMTGCHDPSTETRMRFSLRTADTDAPVSRTTLTFTRPWRLLPFFGIVRAQTDKTGVASLWIPGTADHRAVWGMEWEHAGAVYVTSIGVPQSDTTLVEARRDAPAASERIRLVVEPE